MQKNDIYKCNICGNIIELVEVGGGELVCCGKPMIEVTAKSEDQWQEKHVPVVEKISNGIKVSIGSVEHPMEEDHYIQRIEVITEEGEVYKKFLEPDHDPEAEFPIHDTDVVVREYCSLHGLWKV